MSCQVLEQMMQVQSVIKTAKFTFVHVSMRKNSAQDRIKNKASWIGV